MDLYDVMLCSMWHVLVICIHCKTTLVDMYVGEREDIPPGERQP